MGDLQTNHVLPSLQVQFKGWEGPTIKGVGDLQLIQFITLHVGSIGTGFCNYLACWVYRDWGL